MKKLFTLIRIFALAIYIALFTIGFDLFSCVVGFLLVLAITTPLKNKKPEADTSSF